MTEKSTNSWFLKRKKGKKSRKKKNRKVFGIAFAKFGGGKKNFLSNQPLVTDKSMCRLWVRILRITK